MYIIYIYIYIYILNYIYIYGTPPPGPPKNPGFHVIGVVWLIDGLGGRYSGSWLGLRESEGGLRVEADFTKSRPY